MNKLTEFVDLPSKGLTKFCTKCNIEQELISFVKNKNKKDGLHNECKKCTHKRNILNKNKTKEYNKLYNKNNKIRIQNKNYINNNKEKFKKILKEYSINNKEKIREQNRNRYKTNIHYRIKDNLRSRFYHAIKGYKIKSALDLLGCSIEEFTLYIEQQFKPEMNWSNRGIIWELDHIKGCCNFDLTKLEEQQKCFHYTNLQPLFKTTEIANDLKYKEIGNRNKIKQLKYYE